MATKSFLKSISIEDRKKANGFISALENAENKGRKSVDFKSRVVTIKDSKKIKEMFGD